MHWLPGKMTKDQQSTKAYIDYPGPLHCTEIVILFIREETPLPLNNI